MRMKVLAAGMAVPVVLALMSLPAQAQPLEPNPCLGRSDSGVGGSIPSGDNHATIYGTWYNCSGGTGSDHVKIDVQNGSDGPCISVPYGTTGSSNFFRSSFTGGNPTYRGWIRC
jgi:hypothetical protein